MTEGQSLSVYSRRLGTYLLLMISAEPVLLRVGRLGVFPLSAGWYVYVGSALGPGGLRARISRHIRVEKKLRWHIDYLLEHASLREVWYVEDRERLECVWARLLGDLPGSHVPVPGFGSSDCRCASHLFRLVSRPSLKTFRQMAGDSCGTKICRVILHNGPA